MIRVILFFILQLIFTATSVVYGQEKRIDSLQRTVEKQQGTKIPAIRKGTTDQRNAVPAKNQFLFSRH
jgi:hypothetical protein